MLTEGAGGELQHRRLYAGGGALSPARGGLGKLEKAGARVPPRRVQKERGLRTPGCHPVRPSQAPDLQNGHAMSGRRRSRPVRVNPSGSRGNLRPTRSSAHSSRRRRRRPPRVWGARQAASIEDRRSAASRSRGISPAALVTLPFATAEEAPCTACYCHSPPYTPGHGLRDVPCPAEPLSVFSGSLWDIVTGHT